MNPLERSSPNFDDRPEGGAIDLVVLHYTDMTSAEEALDRLCDPDAKVSAHYLIDLDGAVNKLVDEQKRAWHAGVSYWAGHRNVNDISIGIELQNQGHDRGLPDYPDAQVSALVDLLRAIQSRHSISTDRIVGHSDVAPDRKIDPGEHFPWDRLAAEGLAQDAPSDWQSYNPGVLPDALLQLGYDPEVSEDQLLDQFCRRWARWGVTPEDAARAARMAAALLS